MMKPEKKPDERRKDYAQRLKTAVRKAHDPLFTLLRSPPETPRRNPPEQ